MNSVSSALSFTLLHEAKLLHFVQLEDSIKTLYKTMLTKNLSYLFQSPPNGLLPKSLNQRQLLVKDFD